MAAVGERIVLSKMPGYTVATSLETIDSSTFTAETQIGSITAALEDGVTYWVECGAKIRSTVSGDVLRATMYEDNTSGTLIAAAQALNGSTSGSRPMVLPLKALYTATATGNKTFVITAQRVSGSGDVLRDVLSTSPQICSITVAY